MTIFFFLIVKLMFLSWNWEKVYSKEIVKSILRCLKTINSPKNYFREKQLCKEWSHTIVRTARNNNTHFFPLTIGKQVQTFSLKFRHKRHGRSFTLYCWVMDALGRCLGRIAKLTTTRGIVYWRYQRAQWEYVARSCYCIWLGEFCTYVIIDKDPLSDIQFP